MSSQNIRSETLTLSSSKMVADFGIKSVHYARAISQLFSLFNKAKEIRVSELEAVLNKWKTLYSQIYGRQLSTDVFLNHVYLAIITKVILFLKFYQKNKKLDEIVRWDPFLETTGGKSCDVAFGLTRWLESELLFKDALVLFHNISEVLSNYDLTYVQEDIFRGLYEEVVEQAQRHGLGEYYTPKWLVKLILKEVFSEWDKSTPPKILDPSCGSGAFLVHVAIYLKNKYKLSSRELTKYVAGIDINPLAIMMARTNLALVLSNKDLCQFQLYNRDVLRGNDLFNLGINGYDIIVGNPPWIVLRSIKNKNYQNFIKKEMIKYKLVNIEDAHLNTQLDTSTLFFVKCVDEYLHKDGIIGFVMPKSVIGNARQHKNFRKFEYPAVKLIKIIDLEEVSPLFNMPGCVLIGRKGSKNVYPVPLDRYSGQLPDRDLSWQDAKRVLSLVKEKYTPRINEEEKSYYYDKFKVGLSIFPRSFYFVDIQNIDGNFVLVSTSEEIYRIVKEPWRHKLTGKIEKDFIFCTLLPWKMVPFGYMEMHLVVLPVLLKNNRYILLELRDIQRLGYVGLHSWFEEAQRIWDAYKTERAKERFPYLSDRLNYNNLIEFQHPNSRYVVLYNATGKDITSCVVDREELPKFIVNDITLSPKGFIADVKTWIFETDSQNEAYYLSTILNSSILNNLIKPFQPRGLYGARAIHRRPLEFPIPKFDEKNEAHIEIALMGKKLHSEVQELIRNNVSKRQIEKYVRNTISKIDKRIKDLLQNGNF